MFPKTKNNNMCKELYKKLGDIINIIIKAEKIE